MQNRNSSKTGFTSPNQIFLVSLLFISFVVTFFPVWSRLVDAWYHSDDYSHGFFIIPVSLFIIWQKKDKLAALDIKPSKLGLIWILLSLLLYLVAHFGEIKTMASVSMVIFMSAAVIYLYGYSIFKELLFPLFILLFMIPVPGQVYVTLTIPLQLFVSAASTWIASILDIPIYREGNVIHLPEHALQVVRACSGLRSMMSLLTLSAVFGYLTLKSKTLRAILFFSGIPIAIAVNVIRVLIMIFVLYYFNYDLARGNFHTIFGIVIFLLALVIIAMTKGALSIWDGSATQK